MKDIIGEFIEKLEVLGYDVANYPDHSFMEVRLVTNNENYMMMVVVEHYRIIRAYADDEVNNYVGQIVQRINHQIKDNL